MDGNDAARERPSGADGPHAFVDDVETPILSDHDADHLTRSLRLRLGDSLTVSDGRGAWRACRFGQVLDPVSEVFHSPDPFPALTVGIALTKGVKPELAVQKLTELSIDTISVFVSTRSIPRWDPEREAKNMARLGRVAREAAMQSRRTWLPEIKGLLAFDEMADTPGAVIGDMEGASLEDQCVVLIGPEGGWTDDERRRLPAVRLAPGVLRAETAAIVAGALLAARHR
ncbi:MAG: RsmE family RNA methyltransferase [Acidimicrobiales bacterium]